MKRYIADLFYVFALVNIVIGSMFDSDRMYENITTFVDSYNERFGD